MDPELAGERLQALMEVQAEGSKDRLGSRVGSQVEVVIYDVEADTAIARSYAESPEVDGTIRVAGAADLSPGQRLGVRITDFDEHDLLAEALP